MNDPRCHRYEKPRSRRDFLFNAGLGVGSMAFTDLLARDLRVPAAGTPKRDGVGSIAPRAKSVIFLFMEGGPSQMDLLDPKPLLQKLAGQRLPESFGKVITAMGEVGAPLLASKREWTRHAKTGQWFSDWIPHIGGCSEDIAVIRSCKSDGLNHSAGVCQMNTGSIIAGKPSLGSWVSYGIGSENRNLPDFVVMQDNQSSVVNGPRNWGSAFLPAVHQGVRIQGGTEPIPNLLTPDAVAPEMQRAKLDLISELNRDYAGRFPDQSELSARLAGYEMAFRMQAEAPGVVDLNGETEATRKLYGLDDKTTETMGRLCLLSRRMVERGVRFVQIFHGAGSKWDAHAKIEDNHSKLCASMDKPVAGLLKDLKSRGLLDETLVVWGGEFGRTPMSEKGDGRDHNPTGFSMWMAGGGVKGGQTIGSTDELGLRAQETPLHVHDLHATILWLLGIDNMGLSYRFKGRPERPTQNEGGPYKKIVG
ncbi:MAG: DUF1501 domain-containing protein [Verrucomicrobiota bacterium]